MNPHVVLAIVPDLFFAMKVRTTATHAGVRLVSTDAVQLIADAAAHAPARIIVDLHAGAATLDAIRALKSDPALGSIPVTGFYSHVDNATRQAAQAAGVDEVLPRSVFTAKLAEILGTGRDT